MLRFGTRGMVLILVVVCLWLCVLTHYALTVVEERSGAKHQQRSFRPQGDAATAETPDTAGKVGGDAILSVSEKMLQLQMKVLRQKLVDSEADATAYRVALEAKMKALEAQLEACRHAATLAKADQKEAEGAHESQRTQRVTTPRPHAPDGLNAYEQEQWKVRQYQQEQRDRMLQARREVVNAQREAQHQPQLTSRSSNDKRGDYGGPPRQPQHNGGGGNPSSGAVKSVGLEAHIDHLMANVARHGPIIPVVIVAYQRADVLKKCIETVLRRMPSQGFQLFASQDSRDFPDVTSLLDDYHQRGKLIHMTHERNTSGGTEEEYAQGWEPYFAISHHFRFVLSQVFDSLSGYDRVILIEEDIEVGVDFFEYMTATSPLLDQDSSLYCVSAWNDNGKAALIQDPRAVYRTDFFPGLGWMMGRSLWEELGPIWPNGFWDDWLRQPAHRRSRACLRPEVPRSFTWCTAEGVSQGQFCAEHLASIKLADTAINWKSLDLSALTKDAYDGWLDRVIEGATEVKSVDELDRVSPLTPHAMERMDTGPLGTMPVKEVKLYYATNQEYEHLAQQLTLMDDFKDDVPRTAYKGIVSFRRRQLRVHLVPVQPLYR
jgi:alpha-1,3-mannosyl-glycoprotein beta-1,2-N-acetylglucosaminyltransferase